MTLEKLKQEVCDANIALKAEGLVACTWGNVSGLYREENKVVIKPSGVAYADLTPASMIVVDLLSEKVVEGDLKPSSDLSTHCELYRNFKQLGGVVHTHSTHAVAWAQAQRPIPCLGTTHADYFYGDVPLTRQLTAEEIESAYELNTGKVIVETYVQGKIDPVANPAVLVSQHGPFTWGKSPQQALYHSVVLENVAKMAWLTFQINPQSKPAPDHLVNKHYQRKHGPDAYYGQK